MEQAGKILADGTKSRKKTGNKWFEVQDQIAYYPEFEKEKVVYPNMTKFLPFVYDSNGFYTNDKSFIITGENYLKYLTGYFNSRIAAKWIRETVQNWEVGENYEKYSLRIFRFPLSQQQTDALSHS